nr:MAG TPA: portal protein [Caudoviricetes sp.]
MSILSAIFDAGKVYNFEQAFGVKDITTAEMKNAINDWYGLYYASAADGNEDPCQRLPVAIVAKLYKAIFSEYKAEAAGAKAEFVGGVIDAINSICKKATQQMLIGGNCFIKPLLTEPLTFGVINRQNYMTLARSSDGSITDIGTAEQTRDNGVLYTLLERRTVDAAGYLTIKTKLYRSSDGATLGVEVPLDTLDKYASLEPIVTLPQPVFSVGLIPFNSPAENCVDGSADAVSVYAAATGLIHNINRNEAQINTEFENGTSRIIVSDDMLVKGADGKKRLSDNVFTAVDEDASDIGVTIFSPSLREQSFLNRKTEYLRNIESLIGLKRGLLSEVEAAERTATEITSSAGEYNLTLIDFQQEWERVVREAVRVSNIIGQIYNLTDSTGVDPNKDVTISWGNGILYDEDQVWADYKALVAANMLKPEIALGWYFDMPVETERDLAKIREKYMPVDQSIDDGSGAT